MEPLLDVKNLKTQFFTQDGVVRAVDDVSFHIMPGETLGIVGESGCGKSITAMSLMRLIPSPPGRIVAGSINFEGEDILSMSDEEMRNIRGNKIAMIFQDPMTSLNPVLSISRQIGETLELHMGMSRSQSRRRAIELLQMVGILRWYAPARDDRHGAFLQPEAADRRRAYDGAGRDHSGADP
jgi:oligopeptide transport system ATP-binding protein